MLEGRQFKPKMGVEPTTPALRKRCSAIELLRRVLGFQRAERILAPAGAFQADGGGRRFYADNARAVLRLIPSRPVRIDRRRVLPVKPLLLWAATLASVFSTPSLASEGRFEDLGVQLTSMTLQGTSFTKDPAGRDLV
jgi:hypothetical protein